MRWKRCTPKKWQYTLQMPTISSSVAGNNRGVGGWHRLALWLTNRILIISLIFGSNDLWTNVIKLKRFFFCHILLYSRPRDTPKETQSHNSVPPPKPFTTALAFIHQIIVLRYNSVLWRTENATGGGCRMAEQNEGYTVSLMKCSGQEFHLRTWKHSRQWSPSDVQVKTEHALVRRRKNQSVHWCHAGCRVSTNKAESVVAQTQHNIHGVFFFTDLIHLSSNHNTPLRQTT